MTDMTRPGGALVDALFYGNYFYGICAVAQVLETSTQLGLPTDNAWLYAATFIGTTLFYTYPYAQPRPPAPGDSARTGWYRRHADFVRVSQAALAMVLLLLGGVFAVRHGAALRAMSLFEWCVLLGVPALGAVYYGGPWRSGIGLRRRGWLKPFVIGGAWAGVVVAYPLLFAHLQYRHTVSPSLLMGLLFVKTFMFVSMLAMLFDIKDQDDDRANRLDTWPVTLGVHDTRRRVVIPLTLLGVVTFLSYATMHAFSTVRMALVLVPFALLLATTASLRQHRSLLYYLVVVDGLMLVKALFGIASMHV